MEKPKNMPDSIKKVGFDFEWDDKKLWDLKIESEYISIDELTWHFELPFWNKEGGRYNLTPNEVIANPVQYGNEYNKIMECDLKYPLNIMFNNDRWVLLDGLHRLAKAYLAGETKIKVRKVPKSAIPIITK